MDQCEHGSKLAERVSNHDLKFAKIETVLERLLETNEKFTDSVVKIEKLLTKLDNIEENTVNEFDRVHSRIDDLTDNLTNFQIAMQEEHKTLEPITISLKHPWMLMLMGLGLCAFAIKDIRDPLLLAIKNLFGY